MNTLSSNLSQSERLAYYAGNRFQEQEQALKPRFPRPPTINQAREHDARLFANLPANRKYIDSDCIIDSEYESDGYGSSAEKVKIPTACAFPRNRAEIHDSLRSMGCAFND